MVNTQHVVAGHTLTLTAGVTYLATREFATRGKRIFPVTIETIGLAHVDAIKSITISGLSYDQANELLNGFNHGESCWDGRTW